MKKKLKDFFNYLEALPESRKHNCVKDVQQLRSYYGLVVKKWPYANDELYNKITRKVVKLQTCISEENVIQELRRIQSKCDKLYNQQEYEQEQKGRADQRGGEGGVLFHGFTSLSGRGEWRFL